jgi:hypothetical protein
LLQPSRSRIQACLRAVPFITSQSGLACREQPGNVLTVFPPGSPFVAAFQVADTSLLASGAVYYLPERACLPGAAWNRTDCFPLPRLLQPSRSRIQACFQAVPFITSQSGLACREQPGNVLTVFPPGSPFVAALQVADTSLLSSGAVYYLPEWACLPGAAWSRTDCFPLGFQFFLFYHTQV